MAAYDPSVIVTFADSLYAQAATILGAYTLMGALVGAGVGAAVGSVIPDISSVVLGLVGAVFVGAVAWELRRQKAAALRLQAQVALCQVQIEANTRYLRNS
jgi:hypothetical protein